MQAKESHKLLSAIEHEGVAQVRVELQAERDMADVALTSPSLVEEHAFRTPLMAAVTRGDLPILTALLRRLEQRFSNDVRKGRSASHETHRSSRCIRHVFRTSSTKTRLN